MQAGEQIAGRYRLDTRLGRGGMGEVWQAYDVALGRPVAVKVLLQVDAEHEALQRFRREASIGARLQHPGITVVHDVGHHDGRLFLVMELLEGTDLAHLLARSSPGGLPVAEALDLGVQAAEALAAAHAGKVVHRDLKPANLFLLADGRLKICDFGIAWTSEATEGLTVTGRPFGSPPYMAPEQWRGEHVTVQCDLYALGCVLHALLTGAPPFPAGEQPWALMRRHLEDVPPPLRSIRADVPAGVEALVAELLAKDPAARPDAATAVRRLREEAAGGAETAGAAGASGAATYPRTVMDPGAGAGVPTVTALGAGPVPHPGPAPQPGAGTTPARGPRRRSLVIGGFAALAAAVGGTELVLQLKDGGGQRAEASFVLRGFTDAAYTNAFSRDGKTLATGGGGNAIVLWDVATGSRAGVLNGTGDQHSPVYAVAYSPDGKIFAEAGWDGDIQLWDTDRLTVSSLTTTLPSAKAVPCNALAFSPDGRTLAAGGDDTSVALWDVAQHDIAGRLAGAHKDPVLSVAYSPDGKSLLSIDAGGTVVLWNVPSQVPFTLVSGSAGYPAKVSTVAFGPDGKVFASTDGSVRLWEGVTADRVTRLPNQAGGPLYALAFSPDGKLLATGAQDGTVELWNLADRTVTATLEGHTDLVLSVAFSPDSRMLAAASADRTVRLWKLAH